MNYIHYIHVFLCSILYTCIIHEIHALHAYMYVFDFQLMTTHILHKLHSLHTCISLLRILTPSLYTHVYYMKYMHYIHTIHGCI